MTDSEKKFKEWNRKVSQNAIELIRAKRTGKPEEEINELIRQESEHNVELIKNLQEDEKFAMYFLKNEIECNEGLLKHFAKFISELMEDYCLNIESGTFDDELQMIFSKALIDYLQENSVEVFHKVAKEVNKLLD